MYAKYFSFFNSEEELLALIHSSLVKNNTRIILGGGSNCLFTKNIEGIVLKNMIEGIRIVSENDEMVILKVGAGMNWHTFVLYCVHHGYGGVENLSLIPGSVGASPMQNIGAYGAEMKDVFHSLEAIHVDEGYKKIFNKAECQFGYRESIFKNKFKNQFVITSVTFQLTKKPVFNISYGAIEKELENMGVKQLTLSSVSQAVMNIRNSKLPDPKVIGNAGSFFKNPEIDQVLYESLFALFPSIIGYPVTPDRIKIPAGWLIEQAGWKGFRDGDVGCYEKQALVIVNYGKATGAQLLELSENIIDSVEQKFGIRLQREVNVY